MNLSPSLVHFPVTVRAAARVAAPCWHTHLTDGPRWAGRSRVRTLAARSGTGRDAQRSGYDESIKNTQNTRLQMDMTAALGRFFFPVCKPEMSWQRYFNRKTKTGGQRRKDSKPGAPFSVPPEYTELQLSSVAGGSDATQTQSLSLPECISLFLPVELGAGLGAGLGAASISADPAP